MLEHGRTARGRRLGAALLAAVTLLAAIGTALPSPAGASTTEVVVSATSLDFGRVSVGDTSPSQPVILRNLGDTAVPVSVPAPTGPFTRSTTCTMLAPGATCTVAFAFKPTAPGAELGSASIVAGSSELIALYGRASGTPFPLTVSTTGLNFGNQGVGTTSAVQTVSVRNTSAASLSWTSGLSNTTTPSFTRTSSCANTLAAGSSCTIAVTFNPKVTGVLADSFTYSMQLAGGTEKAVTVKLTGYGLAPLVVSPNGLAFGDVVVGTISPSQSVTVRNTATAPVTFTWTGAAVSNGLFERIGTCTSPQTLVAGGACTFVFRFKPLAANAATALATAPLQVAIPGTPYAKVFPISMSGRGVAAAGDRFPVLVSPRSFAFGDVPLGSTAKGFVFVENVSGSAVTLNFAGGGFNTSNGFVGGSGTCGNSITLGAAGSCYSTVTFSPTAVGAKTNSTSLQVTPTGKPSQFTTIDVAANGVPTALAGNIADVDFGSVAVGSSAPPVPLIVTNHSLSPVTFTDAGGGFSTPRGFSGSTGTCTSPQTLAGGDSCAIATYGFSPYGQGPARATTSATASISTGAPTALTLPMAVSGFGSGAGPLPWASPMAVDFGSVPVGTQSPGQVVTLHNSGSTTLSGISVSMPSGFSSSGVCATLAPGAVCNFTIRFQPSVAGSKASRAFIEFTGGSIGVAVSGHGRSQPTAVNDSYSATKSVALVVGSVDKGVLANDAGVALKVTGHTNPAHGTVSIAGNGTFTYKPTAGYVGSDTFTYTGTDSVGGSDAGTVTITVKQQVTPPNAAFTKAAYQDFLDRAPSAGELSSTVSALNGGTKTRRQVVDGLASSPDWVSAIVDNLYQNTLGRAGEPGGVAYWTDQLRTGKRTVAQVSAAFYASKEYFEGLGGGTNAAWVSDLFDKLLLRTADSASVAYWSAEAVAKGRTSVAFRLFQSNESCRRRVDDLYKALLDRLPDAGGQTYWAGKVATGGDIVLAADLASSLEYFQRAQTRFP